MESFSICFLLLTIAGVWRPIGWSSSSLKYRLYSIYMILMQSFLHVYTTLGLLDIFYGYKLGAELFFDKFGLHMSVTGVSIKVINMLHRRNDIIALIRTLKKGHCLPRDPEEAKILEKFDRGTKSMVIWCEILNEACASCASVSVFIRFLKQRTSSDVFWSLYDISTPIVFWFTAVLQSSTVMLCANISVAHDGLIATLMVHCRVQLELFCHRLRLLGTTLKTNENVDNTEQEYNERSTISGLIRHHLFIYEFAEKVNDTFTLMILLQFSISSMVLCMSVYMMSTKNMLSLDFLWIFLYLGSMLLQIFIYCWYGNEMTLQSKKITDAIYEADWTSLRVGVMKDLLFVMRRCAQPIKMTSGHIIVLSIESFMSILKVSYSTYNVLASSKN